VSTILDRLTGRDSTGETPAEKPDEFDQEFAREFGEELAPDPVPAGGWTDSPKGRGPADPAPALTTTESRAVAAELRMYIELIAGAVELTCEPCAGVIDAQRNKVAARAARIAARYPAAARKLIAGAVMGDILGLAAALRPIAKHAYGHHVSHSIAYEGEDDAPARELASYGPRRG
jgi:hypothetical protein